MQKKLTAATLPHPKLILGNLQKQTAPLIAKAAAPGVIVGFTDSEGSYDFVHAEGCRHQIDPSKLINVDSGKKFKHPYNAMKKTELIHLGSCSKAVTATAILNLTEVLALKAEAASESPALTLSTKLVEVLPEHLRGTNPKLEQATLQQFLDHRSGYVDWRQTSGFSSRNPMHLYRLAEQYRQHGGFFGVQQAQWRKWHEFDKPTGMCSTAAKSDSSHDSAVSVWLQEARHAPLEAILQSESCRHFDRYIIPGHVWKYSRTGYALAAYMAERATGQPFERILQEYLFSPLGMESAGFGEPTERSVDTNGNCITGEDVGNMFTNAERIYAASSHSYSGWWQHKFLPEEVPRRQRSFVPAVFAPASDISMTMEDYLKFLRFHMQQIREDADFQSSAGHLLPSMYSPAETALPGYKDARGGGLSKAAADAPGGAGMSYRNGWIVDEGLTSARRKRADDLDAVQRGKSWQWLMHKVTGTTPGLRAVATSLPLNLSHDGSHGGQYCYTIMLPGKGYAACIWANASTYSLPSACVGAVKRMLSEIDPEMYER